jgi:hypothetical protein
MAFRLAIGTAAMRVGLVAGLDAALLVATIDTGDQLDILRSEP